MTTTVATAQTKSPDSALDAGTASVNVIYSGSEGVVRLNGIPLKRFGTDASDREGQHTLMLGLAKLAVNGENTLVVETKPIESGHEASTEALVFTGNGLESLDHPVFRKKVDGAATIRLTLTLRDVPHHIFDDATPWKGDTAPVLAAVKSFHEALAKRDMKAIAALLRPEYDSTSMKEFGPFDDMMHEFEENLKRSKVAALSAKLTVESFYDGRLLLVSDANGAEPIRCSSLDSADGAPEMGMETGGFWCYRQGVWIPLAM
jgi:hypothetical protein